MPSALLGSTWKKWDLHVHTPESFVHNYPGEKEVAWEAFLTDLENLPEEFKVIGINDYVLVDGYERVLKAKKDHGRLANIDLILPVVELRIDKFGGVVKGGKGGYSDSSWSRINLHVIFDQVDPEFIRQQFISAISPSYKLTPNSSGGVWNGVISRNSIEDLGNTIINSVPEDKRDSYSSALLEGFNNLNISADGLYKALENSQLYGKFIIAVGKTEWEDLKWNDHTVAEKKTIINNADLVFTAAQSPDAYDKARASLLSGGVNAKLMDCSDAHWLSTSTDKDRVGNCFTWIKAETSFQGLLHAIGEFDDRIYVGDNPPKRQLVDRNRTKFIRSVNVSKKTESSLPENWFDLDIPLNSDLVAIIGNKGSGKSALSDIIALAGNTKNHASFSFLNPSRFRNLRTRIAHNFVGTLIWQDGVSTSQDLDKDPDPSSVERVKYLPQSYLELLCNELGEKGSDTFDAELRKIIYSHVPDENRLGKSSMDALLQFKVAEIDQARKDLKKSVSKVNSEILEIERRLAPEFKKGLNEKLTAKKAELSALEVSKPLHIEDPNTSPEALEESKIAAAQVDLFEQQLLKVAKEEADLREAKNLAAKRQAISSKIEQSLNNQERQFNIFLSELKLLVDELESDISIDSLIQLRINKDPIDAMIKITQAQIELIDSKLQSTEPDSIPKRREALLISIAEFKGKLDERQRLFVRYKEELVEWEKAKTEIIGTIEKPESIAGLEAEIQSLEKLPTHLSLLKTQRSDFAKQIHSKIHAMVDEYKRLYEPVQLFVKSTQEMDMKLPLEFHVRIEETRFEDQFLSSLNRQVKGSFSGVEESGQLLRAMLQETRFDSPEEAIAFAEKIDQMLRFDMRDGQQGKATRLADQVKKGIEPIEVMDLLFGLEYLFPRYSLTFDGQEIGQLSPGERGLLLLVFYLLVDKDDIPIVIDQPEENLDNQTIYKILVKCIKKAKERRQVIMVTHNPNLAVVCDAEQIIYASCDKANSRFDYEAGAIEVSKIKDRVVQILEGTEPAFMNRQSKYRLA